MARPTAHLANLDLNVLVALRELLRERNVTRASKRLRITQPAASAALSRLRRYFGDDLLVRGKGEYVLTPLAAQLAEQVEEVCTGAERLFATSTDFDPTTTQREFTILMADYPIAVMGEQLSQLMHAAAPQARLHVKLVRESLATEYADTLRFTDGIIAPPIGPFRQPNIRSGELFRDRVVCVVSEHNKLLDTDTPSLEDLARLPWVAPYHQGQGHPSGAPISRQLTLLGIQPHVVVRVESYLAAPYFVLGTDRVALMQERLATRIAAQLDLRVLECPGEPESLTEALWWHECYEDDAAHAWLRQQVMNAARHL